jgi:hypothetical protein
MPASAEIDFFWQQMMGMLDKRAGFVLKCAIVGRTSFTPSGSAP